MKRILLLFIFVFTSKVVLSAPINKFNIQTNQEITPFELLKLNHKFSDVSNYHKNIILLKTKKNQKLDKYNNVILSNSISEKLDKLGASVQDVRAPFAKYYFSNGLQTEQSTNGIERICEITIEETDDILRICEELSKDEMVEYAEPAPIRYTTGFMPNDPGISSQWHIKNVKIDEAWEVVKDKTGVLIGICDSGTDLNHVDLKANIWTNPNETLDGKDNDGNGKIDDINGWDFVYEDNDPSVSNNPQNLHGTHVAGCAAAVTNNGTGIGSPAGLNCKIVATKHTSDIKDAPPAILRGYEGIIYLAKLGAKIINCSWGGYVSSLSEYEIIQEATKLGSTIFVASGNEAKDNDIHPSYPACYPNVISIGATAANNRVANFSSYGYGTPLFAPGDKIYSTIPSSSYGVNSGTSMASPIAAGVGAMVLSVFPNYTNKQIYHQLRSTGDVINLAHKYKAFKKINAYNAVTYNNPDFPDKIIPGASVSNISLPPFDNFINFSSKNLDLTITNYIGKAENMKVVVRSVDGYLTSSDFNKEFELGNMEINTEKNISLQVALDSLTGISDGKAKIMLEYYDKDFYDFEVIYIPIKTSTENTYRYNSISAATAARTIYEMYYNIHHYSDNLIFAVGGLHVYGRLYEAYLQTISKFAVTSTKTKLYPPQQSIPYTVYALSEKNLIVTSATNTQRSFMTHTKDRFTNSTPKYIETTSATPFINYLTFFDSKNGVFVGDPNKNGEWGIAISSDAGENWAPITNSPKADIKNETGLLNVATTLDSTIWFGTTYGRIIKSKNLGKDWKIDTVALNAMILSISFANANRGAAIYFENNNYYLATNTGFDEKWRKNVFDFSKLSTAYVPQYVYGNHLGFFFVVFSNNATFVSKDFGRSWESMPNKELADAQLSYAVTSKDNRSITLKTYGLNTDFNTNERENIFYNYVLATSTLAIPFAAKNITATLTPADIDYGLVDLGKDSLSKLVITNTGTSNLVVSDVKIIPQNSNTQKNDFIIKSFTKKLSPANQGTIEIVFAPKSDGKKEAKVYIANNSQTPELMATLTGEGNFVSFAELSANKRSILWNEKSEEEYFETQSIELKNVGNSNLEITECIITPKNDTTNAKDFTLLDTLPIIIEPNSTYNISIKATPQEEENYNKREALLTIKNNGTKDNYVISLIHIRKDKSSIMVCDTNIFSAPYPNPSKSDINITVFLSETTSYYIDIFDVLGNKLNQVFNGLGTKGENKLKIATDELASGTYYLVLNLNGKRYYNKFVVAKE